MTTVTMTMRQTTIGDTEHEPVKRVTIVCMECIVSTHIMSRLAYMHRLADKTQYLVGWEGG